MDVYSSGEDLIIKTRKPYTITKQRERWTEEEHNKFLEALRLYGRAWQRIEEHIGTKTAVQIRSHAQKFFSKLEKEALSKGIPLGQAIDIDIPPPRPKRKPSNPYPRKTGTGAPTSSPAGVKDPKQLTSGSSLYPGKQMLDLESDPQPEGAAEAEKSARSKETMNEENFSEMITLFQEAPCVSMTSSSKSSIAAPLVLSQPCTLRESTPSMKEMKDRGVIEESYLTVKAKKNKKPGTADADHTDLNGVSEPPNSGESCLNSEDQQVKGERKDGRKESEKLDPQSKNEMQTNQNYPRHVPVHVVDGISGPCMQIPSPDMTYPAFIIHQLGGTHGNPKFMDPTASIINEHQSNASRSSFHQPLPTFPPPFTPLCNNQDSYRSFINISSTFSSLVVSTLLQNPAAHAAASLAASFWPCTNADAPLESPGTVGEFQARHMSPSPSLAAIAAATVAAASAWWAAHGLLPLCPPLHPGFTCIPPYTAATPSTDTVQPPVINKEKMENTLQDPPWKDQQLDPEFSEALETRRLDSKSPPLSSSDSESGGVRSNNELKVQVQKPVLVNGFLDSKIKTRKQVDRSSCGSNTPSGSEVETDALKKHEKEEEDSKEPDLSHPSAEPNNRRSRNTSNTNESWKEVSEEGRLAFQALFSREVLPQSFSPPHDSKEPPKCTNEKEKQKSDEKDKDDKLQLDLCCKTWEASPERPGTKKNELLISSGSTTETGLLITELGHAKLKSRRTGFKPYKRCSVEAKENRVANAYSQGEEKGPKRIRLEGEASTS
uniref:Protein LHY-like n=1 Tax=Nelumbo nucifera TaxID=4432 RepID=A0A822XCJ9_NELNU|nr:TPA_asm: hypothetical protein HUJ06_019533 [Nelumbo nucifera]